MKSVMTILLILILMPIAIAKSTPREVFNNYRDKICLVSYFQNISSEGKIGSYNKIKRYHIGLLVNSNGLVMMTSDVYPASLDLVSGGGGSMLSGLPTDFKARLSNGHEYTADFIGKDDQAGVAFIKITGLPADTALDAVRFSSSANLEITDSIYVMELLSESYQFEPLFSTYIVNARLTSPRKRYLVNNETVALSAGGVVIDTNGKAIGITIPTYASYSYHSADMFDDYSKNYLQIAPSEWFFELIQNPPSTPENSGSQKAWLGIKMQALTRELQAYWKVPQEGGVIVTKVLPESPASNADLKDGDVILAINDSTLLAREDEDTGELRNYILMQPVNSKIRLKIFRKGKTTEKQVKLQAAPKSLSVARKFQTPELGFEIRELTRDVLYDADLPLDTPGVFVFQVDRASPAGIGGLGIGDIIQEIDGKKVQGLDGAKEEIEKALHGNRKRMMLKVLENQDTRFVFIDWGK